MPFDPHLAARLRARLAGDDRREVSMFGDRSFVVDDNLAIAAPSDGNLLVRCDPDHLDDLLTRLRAHAAEMRNRSMSAGWIRVDVTAVSDDDVLDQWIELATEHARRR